MGTFYRAMCVSIKRIGSCSVEILGQIMMMSWTRAATRVSAHRHYAYIGCHVNSSFVLEKQFNKVSSSVIAGMPLWMTTIL